MRACAVNTGVADCSLCGEPTCDHREDLEKMRTAAEKAGLWVKRDRAEAGAIPAQVFLTGPPFVC
jgi:hypothetical protein